MGFHEGSEWDIHRGQWGSGGHQSPARAPLPRAGFPVCPVHVCRHSGTLMSFLEGTGVETQPTLGGQEQQMWLGLQGAQAVIPYVPSVPPMRCPSRKDACLTQFAASSSDAARALEMAGAYLADVTVRLAMNVVPSVVSVCGEVGVCYFPHDHSYVPARGLCVCALKPQGCSLLPSGHVFSWCSATTWH